MWRTTALEVIPQTFLLLISNVSSHLYTLLLRTLYSLWNVFWIVFWFKASTYYSPLPNTQFFVFAMVNFCRNSCLIIIAPEWYPLIHAAAHNITGLYSHLRISTQTFCFIVYLPFANQIVLKISDKPDITTHLKSKKKGMEETWLVLAFYSATENPVPLTPAKHI